MNTILSPSPQRAQRSSVHESGGTPARLTAGRRLPGQSNYLGGDDPRKWRTGVPGYGRVTYRDIYPGIDLTYHGGKGELEYDFVVAPGADPDRIALGFRGADLLSVNRRGDLVIDANGGRLRQPRPFIYQEVGGARKAIGGAFKVQAGDRVGFDVGDYDPTRPLVIDPTLAYSTYLGGARNDSFTAIAVDSTGSAYVTGQTNSSDFPTKNPIQATKGAPANPDPTDAFIVKLNPAGTALDYATYLGGTDQDFAQDIAVDPSGSAYITGSTDSRDFPTKNAFQGTNLSSVSRKAFVAKLNATGSALDYSTYLGGTGQDDGHGIAVDPSGSAYVTGGTNSSDFPTKNAFQGTLKGTGSSDAFVTKLNPTGSALDYSTYLGGTGIAGEYGQDIAVDPFPSASAYITGLTTSLDFPTKNAFDPVGDPKVFGTDAFVTKLNPAGSAIDYSTYLGGSVDDDGTGIAVDRSGKIHVTGSTASLDFPTRNAFDPLRNGYDAFVAKLNPQAAIANPVDGAEYSTYLGGGGRMSRSSWNFATAVPCGGQAVASVAASSRVGGVGVAARSCSIATTSLARSL